MTTDRCLCGYPTCAHRDAHNHALACDEVARIATHTPMRVNFPDGSFQLAFTARDCYRIAALAKRAA